MESATAQPTADPDPHQVSAAPTGGTRTRRLHNSAAVNRISEAAARAAVEAFYGPQAAAPRPQQA